MHFENSRCIQREKGTGVGAISNWKSKKSTVIPNEKPFFFLVAELCFPGHDPICVSDDSITWCGTLLGNQRHDPVVSPTFLGFLRFIVFFIIFIFIKKATRTSNLEYRCNMSTLLEYYSLFHHPASDKESRDVFLKFSEFFVYLSVFIIFVIYAAWFRNCFK